MSSLSSRVPGWAISLVALAALQGCDDVRARDALPYAGIDPNEGAQLIASVGCANCHIIPGISGARGLVGPPLLHMRNRIFIAGLLRNTPDNMVTWLSNPQAIVPGNAMPNMGLQPDEAKAITNYLYTLN